MAVTMRQGNLPHIFWIDIEGDGVYTECAVLKKDNIGNIFYFPLNALDGIDKRRLAKIVQNRNAQHFELWDLMSNITLNNGVNALDYFHQLTTMLTPGNRKMKPQQGVVDIGRRGTINTNDPASAAIMQQQIDMAARAAANAAAEAATAAVKASHGAKTQTSAPTKRTTAKK